MKMSIKGLIMLLVVCLPSILFAQTPPDFEPQVYDVPFDDNVSILVAVGIGYGLLRIWMYKRQESIKNALVQK